MEQGNNCQICSQNKSKYSCPRCNMAYCSLSCYQSSDHLQCSEVFYEQWVHEELKNCQSDSEAKKRMVDILKGNQDNTSEESLDSDDEEAEPDLASRMKDINLDDEDAVWENLTAEERKEFRKLVATGNIITVLPEWEPWWKTKKRRTLLQECDNDINWKADCPAIPSDIPELVKLTKVNPSPYVPFMLLNVLLSYVFTVRWFKGVHNVLSLESISTCISLSATLRKGIVFTSLFDAFAAFEQDLTECKWVEAAYSRKQLEEDLVDIIKGADGSDLFFCLKAAISDLNYICSQVLITLKENKTNHLKKFSGSPPKVNLLVQISRKLNYYLSWIVDHGKAMFSISNLFEKSLK